MRTSSPDSKSWTEHSPLRILRTAPSAVAILVGVVGGSGGIASIASAAAPVVSVEGDRTVELPFSATLSGTVTDDGPIEALVYSWSSVPEGVTFTTPAAASTDAHFPAAGSYTLTLTVSDGAESSSDTLTVTANPAVYPVLDDDTQLDRGWLRVAPAEVGMDQALLDQAAAYASSALSGPGSGMIVRRGRLVHSWGDIDLRYELKSTTKSIGSLALGMAIDDGLLAMTDRADIRLPNVGVPPEWNVQTGWIPQITILQLATHTAGFDKPGGYAPLIFEPGTTWHYSDAGLNWLADLLTNAYGRDLNELYGERVWSVLGVSNDDVVWRSMASGLRKEPRANGLEHREFASGIIANVNAMARVGLLFLRRGVWGEQQVVSGAFVDSVQTPAPETALAVNSNPVEFPGATTDYGILWWTNSSGQMSNVPLDTYWAWGLGDSLIVVIPSLDLVIARAGPQDIAATEGRVWNDSDWNGDYAVLVPFLDPIVQAVSQ